MIFCVKGIFKHKKLKIEKELKINIRDKIFYSNFSI